METEIEELFSPEKRIKDDFIFFYFSGHGLKNKAIQSRRLYLAAGNTDDKKVSSSAVDTGFIREHINSCSCNWKVIILDCCYGGAFGEKTKGGILKRENFLLPFKNAKGLAILTSSSSSRLSRIHKDKGYSVYTDFLLEGIRTGIAGVKKIDDQNTETWITVGDAHNYAVCKVREYEESQMSNGEEQVPCLFTEGENGSEIAFAKVSSSQIEYATALKRYFDKDAVLLPENRVKLKKLQETLDLSDEIVKEIEESLKAEIKRHKKILLISVSSLLIALTLSTTYAYFISNICGDFDENEKIVSVKKGSCKGRKPHGEVELSIKDKKNKIEYAFSGKVNYEDKNNPFNGVLRWEEERENKLTKYEWTGSIENWLPKSNVKGNLLKYKGNCLYKYEGTISYKLVKQENAEGGYKYKLVKHGIGTETLLEHSQLENAETKNFFNIKTEGCSTDVLCYELRGKFEHDILVDSQKRCAFDKGECGSAPSECKK
jgi:hypothetical protein